MKPSESPRKTRFIRRIAEAGTAIVAAGFVSIALAAFAQQPAVEERIEVRLIELDAIVTDANGEPVTGLGPEDFELLENGRPQEITNLTEYREGQDVSVETTGASPAELEAQRQPRTIAILVDSLRLGGRDRRELFDDLRALVEKTMREGDRAQLMSWHDRKGLRELTEMTFDRSEVIDALVSAEATLLADAADTTSEYEAEWFREMAATPEPDGERFDGESQVEWTAQQSAHRELSLMKRKTAALQRVLSVIADPAYRNVLVYVSGSFPIVAGRSAFAQLRTRNRLIDQEEYNTAPMLEAVTRTANSLGVIVYAMRPEIPSASIRSRPSAARAGDMIDSPQFGLEDAPSDRTFGDFGPQPHLPDASRDAMMLENDVRALSILAQETGGSVAIGTAGIDDAVERIQRDLDSYYTLAYMTTTDGTDRERRIELRPRNRDHRVRVRRSVLDRSGSSRARDLLIARLFEHGPGGEIEFDIEAGEPQLSDRNQHLIPITLTIPVQQLQFEPEGDERAARFSVILVAGRNIGEITRTSEASRKIVIDQGTQPSGVVRFDLQLLAPARETNVSIAVFDETSGLAGVQSMIVDGGRVSGERVASASEVNSTWMQALAQAREEEKIVVVYFRPRRCHRCSSFERDSLQHPAIRRRLSDVVFVQLPPTAGALAEVWNSRDPGLGVFDSLGNFRLQFPGIPDTVTLGVVLKDAIDAGRHFQQAVREIEDGAVAEGELHAAIGYIMLSRFSDARSSLEQASKGEAKTRQMATIAGALIDAAEARVELALETLDRVVSQAVTPHVAGEAWLAIGLIHRKEGALPESAQAVARARRLLEGPSLVAATSEYAGPALDSAPEGTGPIHLVPPERQVLSGRYTIRTRVASAEVAAVGFELDGKELARVSSPPFALSIDLGPVPEQRHISAIAFDSLGTRIGRDEIVLNEGGERFWIRFLEPQEGEAEGDVIVKLAVQTPATREIERVSISWNDSVQRILTAAPWEARAKIPEGELGVLRAVAELEGGRRAEDAILLNAPGHVERADVPIVELPVTVSGLDGRELSNEEVVIREGRTERTVVSIQPAEETALTVGLVIDTSGSMEPNLLDVQEAAISFLEAVLAKEGDRAFVIGFATRAELVQRPTSDRAQLAEAVMSLRARGSTSLWDAIAVGLLQFEGVKGRRALVVFTDGADSTSRYGASDVAELSRRSHVPIHMIAAEPPRSSEVFSTPGSPGSWGVQFRGLERLAESSGGVAHDLQEIGDLPDVYREISAALESQFLVFIQTERGEKVHEWREIRVDLVSSGKRVFAPNGYYAVW